MFILLILATYSFEVEYSDTIQNIEPESLAVFEFKLHNTGTDDDVYEVDVVEVDIPGSWFVMLCCGGKCYGSGLPYHVFDTLAAGESDTAIAVDVYTDTTKTTGIMDFSITSQGNPSLVEEFTLYVNTNSGIQDGETDRPDRIPVITDLSRISGKIYDINGRVVTEPSSGVFLLKHKNSMRKVVILR